MNASLRAASPSENKQGKKRLNEESDSESEREENLRQEEKQDSRNSKFESPLVWWIITSLRFFDCAPSEIFRVLQSYNLSGTISHVARHINDNQLPNYQSFPPSSCGAFLLPSLGFTGTVYFANQRPVRSFLLHSSVKALTPKQIVNATTSDGQIIVITIRDSEIHCCSQDLMR